ncbi:MAG: arabinose isomerase [Spirochaetales bacterium]|nr:arabinose isomerase [Spirochaetales bacterium]
MHGGEALKVGIFGIGLDTYWPQFPGLRARLEGYQDQIVAVMTALGGIDVVDAGLVDSPERSRSVVSLFRQQQVEIIFLYISTYALSSTVLAVAQGVKVPIVVLNIQPVSAIDYAAFNAMGDRGAMTGEWLAHCQACCVPEIASVFRRARISYHLVTGYLGEGHTHDAIREWIEAAKVVHTMRNNRLGIMGHYYAGMLDVYTDITKQLAHLGGYADLIEIDELAQIRSEVGEEEVAEKIAEFRRTFDVSPECASDELERTARTSSALDALAAKHRLGSLAYYYEGAPGSIHEDIVTSVIAGNTLLTGRGIPVAGECEIKNAQAMKIMDAFGAGGSFSEFYALDFDDDAVLLGHDGPAHFMIAEGRVGLVPLPVYHGKPGAGLSIQMTVRRGPVTLLSVCEDATGVYLLVAEGASVAGPVLHIGNTNSRYRFPIPAREFIERWSRFGPSHHCAIGVGHIASKIEKFGHLAGLRVEAVCLGGGAES